MKKKYNIFIISRLYLKNYYKYLIAETDIRETDDAFDLFMYSMKKIYDLDVIEYNGDIERYGDNCIEVLKNTEGTPKEVKDLSFEDRVKIVGVCEGYAQAIGLLTTETIRNSRIDDD